jgi:glycosyltransferase involved in cell wall biosynthesis
VHLREDFTIIIPSYNAALTIGETLRSIQAQRSGLGRLRSVELADDASTDDTVKVARRVWKSDVPLQIHRNEYNLGERATVNAAVARIQTTAQWFFILHADDLAEPNWLEVMIRHIDLAEDTVASLTASYSVLRPDGRLQPGENLGETKKVRVKGDQASMRSTLARGCWFKVSSCAIRVSVFRELGGFEADLPQAGDWEFVLRLLQNGWEIQYLPLSLSIYRQSPRSVSSMSFKTHRDVYEGLRIIHHYHSVLSVKELRTRYFFYLAILARRAAVSLLRMEGRRLVQALFLIVRVTGLLARQLY